MPKQTYYITTAIDYPNAKPHIGHKISEILIKFASRSDPRAEIINASLARACEIGSRTPHEVAKKSLLQ